MSVVEVLAPGVLTTVQDWPGRLHHWAVGVPPSGPMDDVAFRIGNRMLGNPPGAAGLEVTLTGPRLRFADAACVAVTGAPLPVELDGQPIPQWAPVEIPAGGVLRLGAIRGAGLRAYVLVRGGLDGERVMGSRATFLLGGFGGHAGRALHRGDKLTALAPWPGAPAPGPPCPPPSIANAWTLRVIPGPYGQPDLLTPAGLEELFSAGWTVHHQSDRSGVRLTGPQPGFARADGGEAGLHPSNILDTAYGVGTIMLSGDTAVIVGHDGPSLGGFVSVARVIVADRWKLGQLRAGDRVRLGAVDIAEAARNRASARARVSGEPVPLHAPGPRRPLSLAPILRGPLETASGEVTFRLAGEDAVLVEMGRPVLDLRSRVRVHALEQALAQASPGGLLDVTAGVRSLHVQHDPDRLSTGRLLDTLASLAAELPAPDALTVLARTVHLPLAWRHSEAMRAVEHYARTVRADAPWCPDNIEFIRRINGLADEDAVRSIVFDAAYLVLGLGDVYLGAPVAVPLDPRHRLVTTKYTPARTWTPESAVGIGGAFLCVYGVEGPGGYQLVGRTLPVWRRDAAPPWRLRSFDQLRFHAVSEEELEQLRADGAEPASEPITFSLAEHERRLSEEAVEIAAFRERREAAFAAEREAWESSAAMAAEGAL